jgi:hypothetical protein
MRTRIKAGITGVALATAATMLVGAPSASGDHQSASSAYGIAIGGEVQQPAAKYPEGPESGGGEIPADLGPLAAGGVLTVTAGNDQATAKITDLTLGQAAAELPQELKDGFAQLGEACTVFEQAGDANQALVPLNEAINQVPGVGVIVDIPTAEEAAEFCNGLLDADIANLATVGTLLTECNDMTGSVTLTDVAVLGAEQPVLAGEIEPETQLLPTELADVAKITLNHQIEDGENFTVQGLRIEIGGQEVAVLASATCGGPIAHEQQEPQPTQPKQAPAPTPVERSVPVTG